jgi:hypothetical protein
MNITEHRLMLFELGQELPNLDEAKELVETVYQLQAQVGALEKKLKDREEFIEKELQKGLADLQNYILAGLSAPVQPIVRNIHPSDVTSDQTIPGRGRVISLSYEPQNLIQAGDKIRYLEKLYKVVDIESATGSNVHGLVINESADPI